MRTPLATAVLLGVLGLLSLLLAPAPRASRGCRVPLVAVRLLRLPQQPAAGVSA